MATSTLRMHHSPLARRVALYTILFSSLITLLLTANQLHREYRLDIDMIKTHFELTRISRLDPIREALWATNRENLQLQLDGIVTFPDIEHVELRENENIWASAGHTTSSNIITRTFPIVQQYRGAEVAIGTLVVVASLDGVYRRIIDRALVILLSNGFKTFLVALFVLFIFHRLVSRHIRHIADYFVPDTGDGAPLRLDRDRRDSPDELDLLVENVNRMRERVASAMANLRESEERYRELVELSSDWIWEMDAELRLLENVGGSAENFGLPTDYVCGKRRWELPGAEPDVGTWDEHEKTLNQRGSFREFGFGVRNASGERRHLVVSGNPRFDDDGIFLGYRGVSRDDTDKLAAERDALKSYRRFVDAIESLEDGFILCDRDDRVVKCNGAYRRLTGIADDVQVEGRTVENLNRVHLERGLIEVAAGQEEAWLGTRMRRHRQPTAPFEARLSNGRWLRIADRRTSDGGWVMLFNDITDLKAVEQSLLMAKEAVDASPVVLARWRGGPGWPNEYVSENISRWGYRAADFVTGGKTIASIVHPDDREPMTRELERFTASKSDAFEMTYRVNTASGETKWIQESTHAVGLAKDGEIRYQSALGDVTDLRRSEQHLRSAQAAGKVGSWELNPLTGESQYWSDELFRLFGLEASEKAPSIEEFLELVHPDDHPLIHDGVANVASGAITTRDFRSNPARGELRYFSGRGLPVADAQGNFTRVIATITDVTDRVLAEEALRDSTRRLEAAVRAGNVGLWEWDLETGRTMYSDQWKRRIGYASDEISDDVNEWQSRLHPDDEDRCLKSVQTFLDNPRPGYRDEFRLRHRNGNYLWILSQAAAELDAEGKVKKMNGSHIDITEIKRAQEEREIQRRQLEVFVKHVPAPIAMFDGEMRYTLCSDRWRTDYGLGDTPIIGRSHYEVFPEMPERWKQVHRRCLEGAVERCEEDPFEHEDGTIDWIRWEVHPWYEADDSIGGIILFTEVITERKRLQEEAARQEKKLMQANRLVTLGTLVSGVAHEVNNPNNLILLNAKMIEEAWADSAPVLDHHSETEPEFRLAGLPYREMRASLPTLIDDVRKSSLRIQKIVEDLKTFSRPGEVLSLTNMQLNQSVEDALRIVAPLVERQTDNFQLELADDLPEIFGDRRVLEQVTVNLVINALEALPGPERSVTVRTRLRKRDRRVVLEVIDQGTGITPNNRERVFDPFFTTKQASGGMGLGLAITQSLVAAHDGEINLQPASGGGTVAQATFPTARRGKTRRHDASA